MNFVPIVTIDGPSGAGKGTVARLLAQHYAFHLLDSGALYRLTALGCLNSGSDPKDEIAATKIAKALDIEFRVPQEDEVFAVNTFLSGEDVTRDIRTEQVGAAASKVAKLKQVRDALLQKQREFARVPGLVADGRDMGTVVFPQAACKFFLTASSEERARRREKQLVEAGEKNVELEKIQLDIEKRDQADINRKESPLVPASDAKIIDCTDLSIDEVFQELKSDIDLAFFCNKNNLG